MKKELDSVHNRLLANKLSLRISKTEYMIIGSRQRISKMLFDPQVAIQIKISKYITTSRTLGTIVDENIKYMENSCQQYLQYCFNKNRYTKESENCYQHLMPKESLRYLSITTF